MRPAVGGVFYASARSVRVGLRVANVHMQLWGEDATRPMAVAKANYALSAPLRRYTATQ